MTMHTDNMELFDKLSQLYRKMETAYDQTAQNLGLTCRDCPDNCCTSYFQHHTYIEWAYLRLGLSRCREPERSAYLDKAHEYIQKSRVAIRKGKRPDVLCPLNEDGLCRLYEYRMMICRLHGVPNRFVRPDGKELRFPGCFRCPTVSGESQRLSILDRTPFYRELAALEIAFFGNGCQNRPRVNLTLAEMIVTPLSDVFEKTI